MTAIAMWSGPRNISTAMMRAWENRVDTAVIDEPLYAAYLDATGAEHPGRDEILASQPQDWRRVVEQLTGPPPDGRAIFYQKQMAHHLLPAMSRDWLHGLRHAFLIREPRAMLTSYIRVLPEPTLAETGLPQQWELFQRVRDQTGRQPPVLVARDVLENPRGLLERLCNALGVPFSERMLHWPAGPRATDGVWARYWYGAVERSTGFRPYRPKDEPLPARLQDLYDRSLDYYDRLHAHRLVAAEEG